MKPTEKNSNNYTITIVMPVYNSEKYIKQVLDSITEEMRRSDQLIIINDGSKDDTRKICEHYRDNYDHLDIDIYTQKNSGVSKARNAAISKASKQYILFVDSDDLLIGGWRKTIDKEVKNNPDIVYFNRALSVSNSKEDIIDNMITVKTDIRYLATPWSKLFKTSFIKKNNIMFNPSIINGEDLLFNLQALDKTNNIQLICESIYIYRKNVYSTTHRFDDRLFDSDKEFQKEISKLMPKNIKINHLNRCLEGAILLFAKRISFLPFGEQKKYINHFQERPYREYLENAPKTNTASKSFIIELIRKKKYNLVLIILRASRLLKPHRKKEELIIV